MLRAPGLRSLRAGPEASDMRHTARAACLLAALSLVGAISVEPRAATSADRLAASHVERPIDFIANRGQWDPPIGFAGRFGPLIAVVRRGRVMIRADGTSTPQIETDGSLRLDTKRGALRQSPPTSWHELPDGRRRFVPSRFRKIDDRRYGFEVDGRDPALPLVIDPGLVWSTFL